MQLKPRVGGALPIPACCATCIRGDFFKTETGDDACRAFTRHRLESYGSVRVALVGSSVIFSVRVHGDGSGASTVGLSDAYVLRKPWCFRLEGPDHSEEGLGGGDQFRIGSRVDDLEFFYRRLPPAPGVCFLFQLFDRLSKVAIVAEFLLEKRL